MNENNKHVDTHVVAWRKNDPNYLIAGTDGGLYESFDQTKTWRFIPNLPLTQYYKLAVDDAVPFYNIYGGTQDNGSHGGPSRTLFSTGIRNADWRNVLGADGHQSAVEPGNPDITYGEYQEGVLFRIDHKNGETVYIQPQPREDEPYERFNWDAPILVSSFDPKRIYVGSYRVWRSDNRGDAWTPISKDLTKNQDRMTLPIMGSQQSWDNPWDLAAMSSFNTITSLAESPVKEGILYAGTDDGIIQVTKDGGNSWTKLALGSIKGVPATAFVNDVRADLFDANTVYAALDNHKYGDFKPYLIKSTDAGQTWKLITNGMPDRLLVLRTVQDHIKKELLFAATEFGIYFTVDAGSNWIKLGGGLPTISFRDITIQRRENDLVGASFGRGFFVLDDYSALRQMTTENLAKAAYLFQPRNAFWYVEKRGIYGQGASDYKAPNPDFGATFTYYLKEELTSLKFIRQQQEKKKVANKEEVSFLGWDALAREQRAEDPIIMLVIRDTKGNIINSVKGKTAKGINRITWDLTHSSKSPIMLKSKTGSEDWGQSGFIIAPGTYTASISKIDNGVSTALTNVVSFEVVPLIEPALKGASSEVIANFRKDFESFVKELTQQDLALEKAQSLVSGLQKALSQTMLMDATLIKDLYDVKQQLLNLSIQMNGETAKSEVGEKSDPTPKNGLMIGYMALATTYGPTPTHVAALDRAQNQLNSISKLLAPIVEKTLPELRNKVNNLGGPWIEGQ